jgi:hypothetical protein
MEKPLWAMNIHEITVWDQSRQKHETFSKKKLKRKGLRTWLSPSKCETLRLKKKKKKNYQKREWEIKRKKEELKDGGGHGGKEEGTIVKQLLAKVFGP